MSKGSLKLYFLDIYLITFSESVISETQKLWLSSFFSKSWKFKLDFKNDAKNAEKVLYFWENHIWIGIVKMSLWRTRYFSSAANMLTSSPMILHVNKKDFFRLDWLGSDQWIWWRCCDPDLNRAWARLPCCMSNCPLKHDFLDIYQTTFSQSVISEPQKLWLASFDSKCSQFNIHFQNTPKNSENFSSFSDNWIWIGILTLSLLRTGYFSSAANVLTSSLKIWHDNKWVFFQLNSLASDQWIW